MTEAGVPKPHPLRRLAVRSVTLGVLTVCVVVTGLLVWDFIHRTHFESLNNFPEFTGWQLYVTAAGVAVAAVTIGATVVALRRRHPLPPGVPRSSRVVWALVAIALGAIVADVSDLGTKHVLDWASSHTAAAARSRAEDAAVRLQMLGDATHPPQPFGSITTGAVPDATLTATLLMSNDLGSDWHLQGPLRGSKALPSQQGSAPGLLSESTAELAQEAWNGSEWVQNIGLNERARRFAYPHQARADLAQELQSARISSPPNASPPGRLHRLRVGGETVWRQDPVSPTFPSIRYLLAEGSTELDVFIIPTPPASPGQPVIGPIPAFTPITQRQILVAAIKRAEAPAQR